MRYLKTFLIYFVFLLISWPSYLLATSGCCSHHDGVCGCSGGMQSCCDGTISPSCECEYSFPKQEIPSPIITSPTSEPTTNYSTPEYNSDELNNNYTDYEDTYISQSQAKLSPRNPIVEANTKLEYNIVKVAEDNFTVYFDWYYPNETDDKDWSVRFDTKAADPGPLADTHRSKITFSNVKPGKYILSVKAKILGEWSDVAYWDSIYVSEAVARDNVPTVIEYASQQPLAQSTNDTNNDYDAFITILFLGSGLLNVILFISTMVYRNKSKKMPTQ